MTRSWFSKMIVVAAVACALGVQSSRAHAECGDVSGDGLVESNDALLVLHKAVGLPAALICSVGQTTTSTTVPAEGDCFSDADCSGPGTEHCCGYVCAECAEDNDCPEVFVCDGTCSCVQSAP